MEHPAFKKFNEKETSQIAQISESLLLAMKIQAQLCIYRDSDGLLILQDIYNQVKKIEKDKRQGRRPIDAPIETLKEENFVWSPERDSKGQIPPCFSLTPFP
ncbi:hypothetical protein O181_023422 [Austropuccinia psidii MF-1]|uniref:Uncharacterized protein n=1 Tax=Austropuccinia psidii MF-1 TaxID=1389203 RepID=A0A9Q3CJH7_9BASI|nr:hypothetical protein [Austropuccinia psidii MF-1]